MIECTVLRVTGSSANVAVQNLRELRALLSRFFGGETAAARLCSHAASGRSPSNPHSVVAGLLGRYTVLLSGQNAPRRPLDHHDVTCCEVPPVCTWVPLHSCHTTVQANSQPDKRKQILAWDSERAAVSRGSGHVQAHLTSASAACQSIKPSPRGADSGA